MLNDFLVLYNYQSHKKQLHLRHPQNATKAGAEACSAELHGTTQSSKWFTATKLVSTTEQTE